MKMVYLGANQCSTSEVVPPQETGSFTISSKPWTPTYEGKIVSVVGHLHDVREQAFLLPCFAHANMM